MMTFFNSFIESWNNLPRKIRIGSGLAVTAVFVSLVLFALLASPKYQPLFTDLAPDDAAAILGVLQDNGISYMISDNGSTISVPDGLVHETRLSLASQGLPRGGVVGFEIFSTTRLGETEADRQLRYLWALQGELTRTIRELSEVQDARIHIVIPRRSLFIQESQPSTASVLLHLNPGVRLSNQQVKGITHLVATSVEGLVPENITIVDNRGNVLSSISALTELDGRLIAERLELERSFEKDLEVSITAMLERLYGYGKVVARVNADLDFDTQEEFHELYEAPTRDGGLVRSQQTLSEISRGDQTTGGVVGVESNIPGYVGDNQQNTEYERHESLLNYELNRIERRHSSAPGSVRRLSVSVWINGDLTTAQLETVENSVAQASGLRIDRGDQIVVNSIPFETDFIAVTTEPTSLPEAQTPWLLLVVGFGIALLGFVLYIRRSRTKNEDVPQIDLMASDEEEEPVTAEQQAQMKTKQRLESLAQEKPQEFAQLVKAWLLEE